MIVIDIETTGVDPRVHALVSIGAVEFDPVRAYGYSESDTTSNEMYRPREFYGECKIWEGASITPEALAINGFTERDITDPTKQSLDILISAFLEWSRGCVERTLAGHNLGDLDLPFLIDSARRTGENFDLAHRVIDTHSLTFMHLVKSGKEVPTKNNRTAINSHFIQEYVGIPHEVDPHNALGGAKWAAEAISRLVYDKPLLEEYNEYHVPWLIR